MLYAFVDERYRYPQESTERSLAVSCVAVLQARYNTWSASGRANLPNWKGGPMFLKDLDGALEALDGFAVIGSALLNPSLLRYGDTDTAGDVPAMARTDNAWSAAVIFCVGRTLARMRQYSGPFSTVDLYLDPKDLREKHRDAFVRTLRLQVPSVHREWCEEQGWNLGSKVALRRIEFVHKVQRGQPPSKLQLGVQIADALCKQVERFGDGFERIEKFPMSDVLTDHLLRWDVHGRTQ